MIHFACSGCGTKLRASDDRLGAKVACPKCGRHVTVRENATRGTEEYDEPRSSLRKASKRPRELEPAPRRKRNPTLLIAAMSGGLTGCIAIVAVIFYAARAGTNIPPGPPNADRPPQLVSAPAPQPQTTS